MWPRKLSVCDPVTYYPTVTADWGCLWVSSGCSWCPGEHLPPCLSLLGGRGRCSPCTMGRTRPRTATFSDLSQRYHRPGGVQVAHGHEHPASCAAGNGRGAGCSLSPPGRYISTARCTTDLSRDHSAKCIDLTRPGMVWYHKDAPVRYQ